MTNIYAQPSFTDFLGLFQYVQTILPFAELSLVCIFVISFLSLKQYETLRALPAALFVTAFSALVFVELSMLNVYWFYGAAVACGLSVLALSFKRTSD